MIKSVNKSKKEMVNYFEDDDFEKTKSNATRVVDSGTSAMRILQRDSPTGLITNQAISFECPKVVLEDSSRTQFVSKLRILNRPNKSTDQSKDSSSSDDVQRKLQKSFEEKQAEYAKARLRILGEQMPNEQLVLSESLNQITIGGEAIDSSQNSSPSKKAPITSNVTREPIVPDGTTGFRFKRNV